MCFQIFIIVLRQRREKRIQKQVLIPVVTANPNIPCVIWQVVVRSQAKRRRSRSTRGTLASRLQQSQPGVFSLKRQRSMLILSTRQRRDRGGRDHRTVSRMFHRPRNPKESGTEAGQGPPRPQILARVLRNLIERTTRHEEIKKNRRNSLFSPFITRNLSYPPPL